MSADPVYLQQTLRDCAHMAAEVLTHDDTSCEDCRHNLEQIGVVAAGAIADPEDYDPPLMAPPLPAGHKVLRYDFDGGTARFDVVNTARGHHVLASFHVLPLTSRWRVRTAFVAVSPEGAVAIMHGLARACDLASEREAA